MKTKIVYIRSGVHRFSLGEFNEFGFNVRKVSFDSNDRNYRLKLRKTSIYGAPASNEIIFDSNNDFPRDFLVQCRDGLTGVQIESNCDGFFTCYLDRTNYDANPIQNAIETMHKKADEALYRKQFKPLENTEKSTRSKYLIKQDQINGLKYSLRDRFAAERFGEDCCVLKRWKSSLPRKYDVYTHLRITSTRNTIISIETGMGRLLKFRVYEGTHLYPCLYISCCLQFSEISITCSDDCLEKVVCIGKSLPPLVRTWLQNAELIVRHPNGPDHLIILGVVGLIEAFYDFDEQFDEPMADTIETTTTDDLAEMLERSFIAV